MAIYDLFSKRQRRARGEAADILAYDELPSNLRVQIIHIWRSAIGWSSGDMPGTPTERTVYSSIRNALCREYGVFQLAETRKNDAQDELEKFFLETDDLDKLLDLVELTFQTINTYVRTNEYRTWTRVGMEAEEAINELNVRFRENGVGYQFESDQLIRTDSTFLHSESVKPALGLLSTKGFEGANAEFLKAHEHFRHGNFKESLAECLKTLESVLKIICKKKGWAYKDTDTSKRLIEIAFLNKLVPDYLQSQFSSLRSLIESGVPTVRNRAGGHGQGAVPVAVPEHLAAYILHSTAALVVFLSKAMEAK
jgi:hypothetical protein